MSNYTELDVMAIRQAVRAEGQAEGYRAGLEAAAKCAEDHCVKVTRLCQKHMEETCRACDAAAALRDLAQSLEVE